MARPEKLRFSGRLLYLTEDQDLLRRQLEGEDLTFDASWPLIDNISTDEITPGWVCFYYDETLGRFSLVGLRGGLFEKDTLKRGGFDVIVSGLSKGLRVFPGNSSLQRANGRRTPRHREEHREDLRAELPEHRPPHVDRFLPHSAHRRWRRNRPQ